MCAALKACIGQADLTSLLSLSALVAIWPQNLRAAYQDEDTQSPVEAQPPNTQQTPEQLQQLVAPIALYPDSLVAQILAASTFPEQVVEADRWVQAHPDLKGDALGQRWSRNLGIRASRRSLHFHPCLEIWIRIFPGRHL